MDREANFHIEQVAELARLELDEKAKERLQADLLDIVRYVEQLSEVDLTGVEPMHHSSDVKNVYREDEAKSSFNRELLLSNAPQTVDGELVKVPAVLPDEEQ